MKTALISIFSGALVLGVAAAQDSTPATPPSLPQTATPGQAPQQTAPPAAKQPEPSQPPQPAASENAANAPKRIAAGSVIPVSLTKTIDAKKAKTGEEVVAKVTQDMKTTTGEVLVPKDTRIVGHVTEAQARSKEQKESEIGIAFDRAVMKSGGDLQMPMSIQAIIVPQNNNPQNTNAGGGGYGSQSAPSTSAPSSTGRSGGMAGGSSPTPSPSTGGGSVPGAGQGATNPRPPITEKTEGVIGISDLKLTTAAPAANQGSLVSSEKNNVKLESGTMLLLLQ
jgi:hypothetical protein